MRVFGVACLPGRIGAEGFVPVAGIYDHAERSARGLVVASAGTVHGEAVAATRSGSDVQSFAYLFFHSITQGVLDEYVFVIDLPVIPFAHVLTEFLTEVVHGFFQALGEDVVSGLDRIFTKMTIGENKPFDDAHRRHGSEVVLGFGHYLRFDVVVQTPFPCAIDARGHRLFIHLEIPFQEHLSGLFGDFVIGDF